MTEEQIQKLAGEEFPITIQTMYNEVDDIYVDIDLSEPYREAFIEGYKAAMLQGIKIDFPEHGKIILTDKDGNTYTSKSEELIDFFHGTSHVIPTLQNKGEWVSVEDRLPEYNKNVLAFSKRGHTQISCVDSEGKLDDFGLEISNGGDYYTHWQLLPAPPEQTVPQ